MGVVALRGSMVIGLIGLAGCSFGGGYGEGYRCGVEGSCPSGSMCVGGFCVSGLPDAPPNDGIIPPAPDADPGAARCGSIALLQDDFTDTARDPQWDFFNDLGTTLLETGGHLAIQLAGGAGNPYAGYTSLYLYDLTDSSFEAEVSQIGGRDTILEVRNFEGERVQLLVEDGDLVAGVYDVVDKGVRAAIPYVPASHRHWRIREADGDVYWEFSSDGSTWNELHHEALPFPVVDVRGILSAGAQLASDSEAHFEAANPTTPALGFCPGATLTDDFAATPLDPIWEFWENGCTLTESAGQVVMTYPNDPVDAWCGMATRHVFELTASGIYVDAMGVASAPNFTSYFQVMSPWNGETRAEIGREGTNIAFVQRVNGIDVDTDYQTYNATNDRYWRIATSGTSLIWQTSPDASAWTTRFTAAAQLDVSEVIVLLGAGHYDDAGVAVTTTFQGVNTP